MSNYRTDFNNNHFHLSCMFALVWAKADTDFLWCVLAPSVNLLHFISSVFLRCQNLMQPRKQSKKWSINFFPSLIHLVTYCPDFTAKLLTFLRLEVRKDFADNLVSLLNPVYHWVACIFIVSSLSWVFSFATSFILPHDCGPVTLFYSAYACSPLLPVVLPHNSLLTCLHPYKKIWQTDAEWLCVISLPCSIFL